MSFSFALIMSQSGVSKSASDSPQFSDQTGTSQKLSRPLWDSQKVSIFIWWGGRFSD